MARGGLACALLVALTLAADGRAETPSTASRNAERVKKPKSGEHRGRGGTLSLFVSGRSISLAAFSFGCGDASGRTALNDIRLKRTRRGYKFALDANGNVTYSDEHPDENAEVAIRGRFWRSGKGASGTFRVDSPRCGDTGNVRWSARRFAYA